MLGNKQRGMSTLAILVMLLVGGFFITCAIKLLPIYMQKSTVHSAIDSAIKKGDLARLSPAEIRAKLSRHFDVNRVDAIKAADIKVGRENGKMFVDARYEQRVALMYNIDVVVKFDDLYFEVPTGSER